MNFEECLKYDICMTVTKDEYKEIIAKREARKREAEKLERIKEGINKFLEGYQQIIDNGGLVQISAARYVKINEKVVDVVSTKRGINLYL